MLFQTFELFEQNIVLFHKKIFRFFDFLSYRSLFSQCRPFFYEKKKIELETK